MDKRKITTIGVPDTAAANAGASTSYQLFSGLEAAPGLISAREDGIQQTSSAQAWSQARMEAAQPLPIPDIDAIPQAPSNLENPASEPVFIPSVPPAIAPDNTTADGEASILAGQSITGYDYPAPFSRFENFDSSQEFP